MNETVTHLLNPALISSGVIKMKCYFCLITTHPVGLVEVLDALALTFPLAIVTVADVRL